MSFKVLLLKKSNPIKFLTYNLKKKVGHNFSGKITVRGKTTNKLKYKYRNINYFNIIWNILGLVLRIEYDPYRRCFLSLIYFSNLNYLTYYLNIKNLIPGKFILNSNVVPFRDGNSTYLKNIPLNIKICNIEGYPFSGSIYLRSAGSFGWIIEKSKNFCLIKFSSSKQVKKFSIWCLATIGIVSNEKFKYERLTKAGEKKLKKKKKQKVRGVAMNAVDHPHGGGKGKKSPPRVNFSPWKKLGKNTKTRKIA